MTIKLTAVDKLIANQPKNLWLIENYFEQESLSMIFGAPASAKSFLAMDIAYCISSGIPWNGNKTTKGKVVYVAGEGYNGMKKRFKVLEDHHNMKNTDIFISDSPVSLSSPDSIRELADVIKTECPDPILIVIDTLHRNFGSGDENSASDVASLLNSIDSFLKPTGATVLFVHHTGHGNSTRARGSSSINGALDVEYCVGKKGSVVTMKCSKVKEFEDPKPLQFELVTKPIAGWFDQNGDLMKSAILIPTGLAPSVVPTAISKRESEIFDLLDSDINNKGSIIPASIISKHPNLAGAKYVHNDDWRDYVYLFLDQFGITLQAKQKAFKRAKNELIKLNKIGTDNNFYWITP